MKDIFIPVLVYMHERIYTCFVEMRIDKILMRPIQGN